MAAQSVKCEAATRHARKAIELDPLDCAHAHHVMGFCHSSARRFAAAKASFARALKQNPTHSEALVGK